MRQSRFSEVANFSINAMRMLLGILAFVLSVFFWRTKGETVNLIQEIPTKIKQMWILFASRFDKPSFKAAITITEIIAFIIVALGFWFDFEQGKLVETQIFASNGISISRLAEQSQWRDEVGHLTMGDRSSYIILASLQNDDNLGKPELKVVAELQIKRVKDLYKNDLMGLSVERLRAICTEVLPPTPNCSGNPKWEPKENFNAGNVLRHLRPEKFWEERARAAYLLRGVATAKDVDVFNQEEKKKELFESLIYFMGEKNEPSLLVSKMALDTYKILADYKTEEVLDFKGAIEDWNKRSIEILKKPMVTTSNEQTK